MTDEERVDEGAEEAIEDLEAPAETLDDVAGGRCVKPTSAQCVKPTCKATAVDCPEDSKIIVVYNQ